MNHRDTLKDEVAKQVGRMRRAADERPTLLAQAVHLGTLGLTLALPIVVGAYVGQWLDEMSEGYSVRWTVSLIVLGLGIGAVTVFRALKDAP
jgi:ATP synthase protein I